MAQYALVPKAEPVVVVVRDDETLNPSSVHGGSVPTDPHSSSSSSGMVTTELLLNLYEVYAETYPNPALQEENHERDRLLRAISAANHAVSVNPKKETKKKSSWWNLFGGSNSTNPTKANKSTSSTIDDESDDDRLVYTDMNSEDQEYDSDFLLGTGFSLDRTCIPDEVHSLARHYLCKNRRKTSDHIKNQSSPKVAHTFWETAGTSCIVIIGLGQMVEFRKRTKNSSDDSTTPNDHAFTSSGIEVYTSDRQQLLDYYSMQRQKQQTRGEKMLAMTQWHPSHADAAMVGPNFLIVHWGLNNMVTFYRRVAIPSDVMIYDDAHYSVTWEAVAVCGATALVRESLMDMFADGDDDASDTELIKVTAIHPLVIEIPHHAPIVTLAVARLGGYIELIPLPPQMWYGAELPFAKKHVQSHVSNQRTQRKKGDGLKIGHNLPDLTMSAIGGEGIVVLNTSDYHSDVLGLESFAVTGTVNDAWDQELYPDGPPAQFILAAFGTKAETGRQAISFWSYTANVSPTARGGVGFSIHSTIVEAIDLGKAGPDVTLFASPTIFRHWRKPRYVKLRDSTTEEALKGRRITTLSLSVPIVQISFVSLDGNRNDNGGETSVCAAVLDWNGGVTLLDCTLLVQTAAQTLSDIEYATLFGENSQNELKSLVHVMASRTRITRSILKSIRSESTPICISYIKCFAKPSNDTSDVMIAALTSDSIYFVCSTCRTTDNSLSFQTTYIPCPNLGIGQFLMSSKRQFILNLIFQATRCTKARPSDSSTIMNFCAVQKLKPSDVIGSLIRSSRFKEAVIAAENLTPLEKDSVEKLLEDCKKALWEEEFDVSVLDSIRDDGYIVDMARRPPIQKGEEGSGANFLQDNVVLYKSVCNLALKRIRNARSWISLSFTDDAIDIKSRLVKLGTYDLLCGHQSVLPSLRQFLNDFICTPMIDFALSCAMKADIATLSVLWFRHREELHPYHFRLVDAIPVSVSPMFYQHILPIVNSEKIDDNSQVLIMIGSGLQDICSFSEIPDYFYHNFQRMIILDEDDESFIAEQYKRIASDIASASFYNFATVADWYLHRTLAIQKFATNLACVTVFARLGLNALQIRNVDTMGGKASSTPSAMSLLQILQFSKLLSAITENDKHSVRVGLKNFDAIDISDIVALTFHFVDESVDFQTRYNDYLLPLTTSKMVGRGVQEINTILDDAIEKFCMNYLAGYQRHDAADLIDRVTICSNIIHMSRASLSISSRIIKQSSIVVRLAANVVETIFMNSSLLQLTKKEERDIIDGLWMIYESLPLFSCSSGDEAATSIDLIGKSLIFLDIVAGWPDADAFMMTLRYQNAQDTTGLLSEGEKILALLCRLFCRQVDNSRSDGMLTLRAPSLLSALLSDARELNTNCFKGMLRLSALFTKYLAKPLVRRCNAGLLCEYLSQFGNDLEQSKAITDEVMLIFNEAVHGVNVGKTRETEIKAVIELQNALRQWLPAMCDDIHPLLRCLDAENFIVSTLLSDCSETLHLEQIQSMRALDVLEYVLRLNPWAIVQDCSDWENPLWAKQTNEMIRHQKSLNIEDGDDSFVQPSASTLPGEAVFHLAQLLGLADIPSVLTVKSRVVDVALALNLDGAAAVVCRSIITDSASTNVGTDVALAAVAKIVDREDFEDTSTKHELCVSAQRLLSTNIKVRDLDSFEIISTSWNWLVHQNMSWHDDTCYSFLSFGLFCNDSMHVSGVNMVDHVRSLNSHLTKSLMNDEIIVTLARYAFIWCIDQTTKAKLDSPSSPRSRVIDILSTYAVVLILHVRDRQFSLDCLKEVKAILINQLGVASEQMTLETEIRYPKPDIVNYLIGRGYSENGARRSAIAVNNKSFHDALQWAVAHSLDIDFDDPYIFLQSTKEMNTDVYKVEFLKHIFDRLVASIDDKMFVMDSYKKQIVDLTSIAGKFDGNVVSKEFQEAAIEKESTCGSTSKASSEKVELFPTATAHNGALSDGDRIALTIAAPSAECPTTGSSTKQQIAVDINGTIPLTSISTVKAPSSFPVVLSSRERPNIVVAIPKSNETSPDRSMLYQVGQEAFVVAQQRQRPSSSTTRAERLRLIEEGRRLLQQARSGLSSDSQHNGYLLRSVPTTPLSMHFNKEAGVRVVPPASIANSDSYTAPKILPEPEATTEKPPDSSTGSMNDVSNGVDEWNFEDENFDV